MDKAAGKTLPAKLKNLPFDNVTLMGGDCSGSYPA
jgi:hypothetical protein